MQTDQDQLKTGREIADSVMKLYGNGAMLSVVKAWKYSAPDKELEKELDLIIKTAELGMKRQEAFNMNDHCITSR